ncbi:ABC transporter ATP-binding protein [Ruminococcus sp. OA3]|uniref:ABC transporter ATP-binding protein n=1 Tax=Ruminococcus sp. OA3 TaxID=2914164 RepID=UPI001F0588C9|nr:ABC transporter ATP-binding protein [Ruminococcus sp. OA3]MCH1983371.1 ABC transporter ATP-binding protein [Ruminococcus sp. OA3]
MGSLLKVEDIVKIYGNKNNVTRALEDVSFEVQRGDFIGVMGPSGSGKTTLLNCIATIDRVSAGHIYLEGNDVSGISKKEIARFRRENLGFVFQDFNLLDTLTIEENIALGPVLQGMSPQEVERTVQDTASKLGITDILGKFPNQVSGGQKQRAACARAMATDPRLILADEPTGALDSHSSRQLLNLMERLNHDMNATILMVTHDPMSASYCSRILFMKDGRLYNEIRRGKKERREFYQRILDVLAVLGGDGFDGR